MIELLRKLMEEQGLAWVKMEGWEVSKSSAGARRQRLARDVAINGKLYLLCIEDIGADDEENGNRVRFPIRCSDAPESAIILYGLVELHLMGCRIRMESNAFENWTSDPGYEVSTEINCDLVVLEWASMIRLVGNGETLPVLNDGLVPVIDHKESDELMKNMLTDTGSIGRMLECLYGDHPRQGE